MKKILSAALFVSLTASLTGSLTGCSEQSATDYLSAAKTHIKDNNFDAATIELKNAIRATPNLAEARFLLGKMYLNNHQLELAEKEFERALEFNYPASEVVPLLSQTYQRTGADNALLKLSLKKAGLKASQAAQVKFYKLQALVNLEQKEKAASMVEEIQALDTKSPFKSLALVYSLLLNNEDEAADIQLNNILKSHPTQPDALKLKANYFVRQGKLIEATDIYRQYTAAYPEDIELSFIFARLLTDTDQTVEAEPIVDKLLKINNKNALLNQLKGIARFKAGDNENALIHSEKAIQDDPQNTGLRLVAGISAYLLEDFETAHQHLSFIADVLPPSHQALRILAASQLKLGLSLEANETINQFDQVTAQDAALYSGVGLALVQQGEIVKAKSVLAKSPKAGESSQALARLGMFQLSLNDVSGIISLESALTKAKEEAPTEQSSIEQVLATAYVSTGKFDKALALAKQWKTQEPQAIKGFMLAGLTHVRAKAYDLAQTEFSQAQTIEPNNPQIKMALIELRLRNEPNTKTREDVNHALERLLVQSPTYIPAITTSYLLQKQAKDTQKIVAHIEKINAENQENTPLKITLAKIYFAEKRFDETIALLSTFADENNKPQDYWRLLGQSYLQQKNHIEATKHYENWVEVQPNNRMAVLGNIMLLEGQRKFKAALERTVAFIDTQGEDPQALVLLAHLSILNGNIEQAKKSYDALPENVHRLPIVKGILAQLQMSENLFGPALVNLKLAYSEQPSSRNARLIYVCYSKLKEQAKGFGFVEMHTQNQPNDLELLMLLAEMQIPKDFNLAIHSYKKALILNDKNSVAHNNIAFLYLQQKELALAKSHAEKALTLQPENIDVLDTLGQVLLLQGDKKLALKHLTTAVNQQKDTPVLEDIYLNYIEALLANGKLELAKRKIEDRKLSEAAMIKVASLKQRYNY